MSEGIGRALRSLTGAGIAIAVLLPEKLSAADNIDRAKELCRSTITARSRHPSTVDIWIVTGTASKTQADGTALVKQIYSEKNDYGLELTYNAYCVLKPNGEFSMWAEERSG